MVVKLYNDSNLIEQLNLEDEEMVELAKSNNPLALEYIIYKYKNFVRLKARSYFIIGADRDDIIQEGMIGLFKAIRDYDKSKLASFKSFAEICITRQIITAIKSATRQKHIPLNSYVSLSKPIYEDDSNRTLSDVITGSRVMDPMELFIGREDLNLMESNIGKILSDLEKEVLSLYIDGRTYQEIAQDLDKNIKSIDNALQRIKKKLEKYLGNNCTKC